MKSFLLLACILTGTIANAALRPGDQEAYRSLQDIQVERRQSLNLDSEMSKLKSRENLYAERLQLRDVVKRVRSGRGRSDKRD